MFGIFKRTIIFLALSLSILSCTLAQNIKGVEFKTLTPATKQATIELFEQISWLQKSTSWLGRDIEYTLLSGSYNVQMLDETGIYFLGPKDAVYIKNSDGYIAFKGGVWIPFNKDVSARFFAIEEGSPKRGNTLDAAINSNPPGLAPWNTPWLLDYLLTKFNFGNFVLLQEIQNDEINSKLRSIFKIE